MKYIKNKKKSKSKAKSKKNTIKRQIKIRKNGTRRASDDDAKLQQELWELQQQLAVREQQLVS